MPTARHTYWRSWDGSRDDVFVRYTRVALEPFGISQTDCDFLTEVGLPAWAAPHMHFTPPRGDVLPLPEDPFGKPYPGTVAGFGMIGSANDWPLCFTGDRPGAVLWLHPTDAPDGAVVNSSARLLAACLLAYNDAVREALTYGKRNGDTDAWRRGLYPKAIDEQLEATLIALDPAVGNPDSFWTRHFQSDLRHG